MTRQKAASILGKPQYVQGLSVQSPQEAKMSDEGYIAVKQGEERNYGTVGMADEEQQPTVVETAETAQVRRDVCLTSA